MTDDALYFAGEASQAIEAAEALPGWRRVGDLEFETLKGERVRIIPDGYGTDRLAGMAIARRIYLGPGWASRDDVQAIRDLIAAGGFIVVDQAPA
jgi:hypothetical protein